MESIERIGNVLEKFYRKNDMKILSTIRYTGIVAAPILAASASVRAYKEIQAREKEGELSLKDKIKICFKYGIVPVFVTGMTVAVTNEVDQKYIAGKEALTTALVLGEKEYRELKEAQKEVVGEEKSKEIQNKANEKSLENEETNNLAIDPVRGVWPTKDSKTGQMFPMSEHKFNNAVLLLNENTMNGQNVYHSEFLEWCGGESCELGFDYYWPANPNVKYWPSLEGTKDRYGRPSYLIKYYGASAPIPVVLADKYD